MWQHSHQWQGRPWVEHSLHWGWTSLSIPGRMLQARSTASSPHLPSPRLMIALTPKRLFLSFSLSSCLSLFSAIFLALTIGSINIFRTKLSRKPWLLAWRSSNRPDIRSGTALVRRSALSSMLACSSVQRRGLDDSSLRAARTMLWSAETKTHDAELIADKRKHKVLVAAGASS